MIKKLKFCKNKEDFDQKINLFFERESKGYCCLINPNIIINSFKSRTYLKIVSSGVFNVCDAISVQLINNFTKRNKIKAYPGPDLFKKLIIETGKSQFFIGGESHALLVSLKENIKNPNITDADLFCPPFIAVNDFDYVEIAKLINQKKPDIIWVGLGAPKQEIFMSKLLPHIDKGLMIGVGAAFNFYSGYKTYKRAPKILRKLKLEWLYRLVREPKKTFPRILRNIVYLPVILVNELFNIK